MISTQPLSNCKIIFWLEAAANWPEILFWLEVAAINAAAKVSKICGFQEKSLEVNTY